MKIGIVGGGVVGRATARAFIEHVDEVRVYDVVPERRTHPLDEVLLCDLVFVCLPTPQKEGALDCDLTAVKDFFAICRTYPCALGNGRSVNYILRSTVPIGTTKRLAEDYGLPNLIHSPEFLTARCAVTDAHLPARNVIGCPRIKEEPVCACCHVLRNLYERRFPGTPLHLISSDESEAVKLFQNGFFAVKVAFWNEVRALADKKGLDWERVLAAVLADGRIGASHTRVPGPDGQRGFGGACLPKDLANLIDCLRQNRCDDWVTDAALTRNQEVDRPSRSPSG